MDNKKAILFGFGTVVVAVIALLVFLSRENRELDPFATCLKDSGAKFYGAFWCPHCTNTKRLFGASADLLPYIECSTPDGKEQLQVCKDAKVETYPTWTFADGSRESGELSLERLAEKTACELPK